MMLHPRGLAEIQLVPGRRIIRVAQPRAPASPKVESAVGVPVSLQISQSGHDSWDESDRRFTCHGLDRCCVAAECLFHPSPVRGGRPLQESRQGHQRNERAGTPDCRRGSPAEEFIGDQDHESSQGLSGRDAPGSGELWCLGDVVAVFDAAVFYSVAAWRCRWCSS